MYRQKAGCLILPIGALIIMSGLACQALVASPQADRGRALSSSDDYKPRMPSDWSGPPRTFSKPYKTKKLGAGNFGTACQGDLKYDESVDGPCLYYLTARQAKEGERAVVKCACMFYYNDNYVILFKKPRIPIPFTQGVNENHAAAEQYAVAACWRLGQEHVAVEKARGNPVDQMGFDVELAVQCTKPTVCYKSDANGLPVEDGGRPVSFLDLRSSDDCYEPDPS